MKARELKRVLEVHLAGLMEDEDLEIVIPILANGIGPTPAVAVKGAYSGFDWDKGRLFIHPVANLQKA